MLLTQGRQRAEKKKYYHTRAIVYAFYCANTGDKPVKSPEQFWPLDGEENEESMGEVITMDEFEAMVKYYNNNGSKYPTA